MTYLIYFKVRYVFIIHTSPIRRRYATAHFGFVSAIAEASPTVQDVSAIAEAFAEAKASPTPTVQVLHNP